MVRNLPRALLVALSPLLLAADGRADASSFSPSATVSLSNGAAGANANISFTFGLSSPNAYMELLVLFEPSQFGVAAGGSVPDGAIGGSLVIDVKTGLFNGACNSSNHIVYTLLDATTNTGNQVAYEDGAADGNGDGLEDAVTKYPDSLARTFPGLTPRARLYSSVTIAGIYNPINVVVFEPGTDVAGFPVDAALGYPAVAVLRNFGDPLAVANPELLTDVCTTLSVAGVLNGVTGDNPDTGVNEGDLTYRTNPAVSGAYNFAAFAVSLRDAENDGIENSLDTCPFVVNAGNPRTGGSAGGDSDFDGLDSACDSSGGDSDEDNDGYGNRQDNCPLVANGVATSNQADADMDQIGDVCDPVPAVPTGHRHARCVIATANVGGGGAPVPANPESLAPCGPVAPGDADGDGFTDIAEAQIGTVGDYRCGNNGWPADLVPDNALNIADINSFTLPLRGDGSFNKFGHPVPDAQDANIARWNLDPSNNVINVGDLNALSPGVNAPTARPPMFGGQPAFFTNGGQCPWAP